jgi:hypothetical protein
MPYFKHKNDKHNILAIFEELQFFQLLVLAIFGGGAIFQLLVLAIFGKSTNPSAQNS